VIICNIWPSKVGFERTPSNPPPCIRLCTPSPALDVLHHQRGKRGSGHCCTVSVIQRNACGWGMCITACSLVTRFADSALILLQTCTSCSNHTLIFTPGAFIFSNHHSSLNLIGHIHIPTCAHGNSATVARLSLPRAGDVYIRSWGGSGLVYETSLVRAQQSPPCSVYSMPTLQQSIAAYALL
jgi:hypothetical protein